MTLAPAENRSISEQSPVAEPAPVLARIDGQSINIRSLPDAVARCINWLRQGRGFTLFTLNLDHLVRLRADPLFRSVYARAAFVTADGAPVVKLARRQHAQMERTTGADLVAPLCAAAAKARLPVFFFGATESALRKAADVLTESYPELIVAGIEAPPFGFDPHGLEAARAGDRIAASGAKLCFIALGAPKQELFADRMASRHEGIGWLGIGAALEFIAGERSRAPRVVQALGLEWLWRFAQEPRRLGLRYLRCAALLAKLSLGGRSRSAALTDPH